MVTTLVASMPVEFWNEQNISHLLLLEIFTVAAVNQITDIRLVSKSDYPDLATLNLLLKNLCRFRKIPELTVFFISPQDMAQITNAKSFSIFLQVIFL